MYDQNSLAGYHRTFTTYPELAKTEMTAYA